MIKLTVAIPCSHKMGYVDFWKYYINEFAGISCEFETHGTKDDYVETMINNHANLPTNRNQLVYDALKRGSTHILFLDSDIIIPKGMIKQMLLKNLPVLGLLCFTRDAVNPKPIIYKNGDFYDPFPEGIIEVEATGTGCLLVKREVFVAVAQLPHFKEAGERFFIYNEMWQNGNFKAIAEDRSFCILLKTAGIPIHVDTKNSCSHLTVTAVGKEHYLKARDNKQLSLLPEEPKK